MFNELRFHKEYLVHTSSGYLLWMTEEDRNREVHAQLSDMLERAQSERDVLNAVLEILFPATQGFLGPRLVWANLDCRLGANKDVWLMKGFFASTCKLGLTKELSHTLTSRVSWRR